MRTGTLFLLFVLLHTLPAWPKSIQTDPPLLPIPALICTTGFTLAFPLLLFLLLLLYFFDGFLGQFLPVHALEHVLLSRLLVAQPDQ